MRALQHLVGERPLWGVHMPRAQGQQALAEGRRRGDLQAAQEPASAWGDRTGDVSSGGQWGCLRVLGKSKQGHRRGACRPHGSLRQHGVTAQGMCQWLEQVLGKPEAAPKGPTWEPAPAWGDSTGGGCPGQQLFGRVLGKTGAPKTFAVGHMEACDSTGGG